MISALIGYTGFVGTNLLKKMDYTYKYNSKNILDIKDKSFDFLVCAGIPAEMFVANTNPEQDKKNIQDIFNIIATVKSKKAVLISTIAVYPQPVSADENSSQFDISTPYGKHRRMAEEQFAKIFHDNLIIRLPALFGSNIKKNFIFDIINPTPAFLKSEKFEELSSKNIILQPYYFFNESKDMYQFNKEQAISDGKIDEINHTFHSLNFTSLQFTNADSLFQFYYLKHLHDDINKALEHNIKELNICSAPISPKEVMKILFNKEFCFTTANKFNYNMKSKHASLWGNIDYLYNKTQVLTDLKEFFIKNGAL